MSLLHAVWLPNPGAPHLALWADTWRVAKPRKLDGLEAPLLHPLALDVGQNPKIQRSGGGRPRYLD